MGKILYTNKFLRALKMILFYKNCEIVEIFLQGMYFMEFMGINFICRMDLLVI